VEEAIAGVSWTTMEKAIAVVGWTILEATMAVVGWSTVEGNRGGWLDDAALPRRPAGVWGDAEAAVYAFPSKSALEPPGGPPI